jgi:hypothetical protein
MSKDPITERSTSVALGSKSQRKSQQRSSTRASIASARWEKQAWTGIERATLWHQLILRRKIESHKGDCLTDPPLGRVSLRPTGSNKLGQL